MCCDRFPAEDLQLFLDVYRKRKEYASVRTNIVIDDRLMRDTLKATGLKTKREAVEEGLRTLLRLSKQSGSYRSPTLRPEVSREQQLGPSYEDGTPSS
jgi:hypothetical protein